jgi:hypothetical protein
MLNKLLLGNKMNKDQTNFFDKTIPRVEGKGGNIPSLGLNTIIKKNL